jgi:hypothetical protein
VPLAAIPALFDEIKTAGWEGADNMGFAKNSAGKTTETLQETMLDGQEASGELLGLVTMLKYYIMLGSSAQKRSFPKGMFNIMSRTDFSKIFSLVPPEEQLAILQHMDEWVEAVTGTFDAEDKLVRSVFNYDDSGKTHSMGIATTRDRWLRDMPHDDRLSKQGHELEDVRSIEPKERKKAVNQMEQKQVSVQKARKLQDKIQGLYEGLGGYKGKTDFVRYEGDVDNTPAVILELRNPPTLGTPGSWRAALDDAFGVVERAIKIGGGGRDFTNPQTKDQKQLRKDQASMAHTIFAEQLTHKLDKL